MQISCRSRSHMISAMETISKIISAKHSDGFLETIITHCANNKKWPWVIQIRDHAGMWKCGKYLMDYFISVESWDGPYSSDVVCDCTDCMKHWPEYDPDYVTD